MAKKKVIAIAGPTASGKTRLAIELAHKLNGEIISADSRLVYKGFNIAVAKPAKEEMSGIKHYLIDIIEPEFDYSAALFYDDAKHAINEIINKGKVRLLQEAPACILGFFWKIMIYRELKIIPN